MTYEHLTVEREDNVAVVTINRHERRNALAARTIEELGLAFDELASDETVGAVVITGAGGKAFCAGADLEEGFDVGGDIKEFVRAGQAAPEGVRLFDAPMPAPNDDGMTGRVPAGCVFWMLAAERTFTTVPADHGNCSVGQYTHGMIDWEALTSSGDVATLLECGWVTVEAAQQLPHVEDAPGLG